jgi:hypothetical protein
VDGYRSAGRRHIKRYEKRIYFEIEYPDEEILEADTGWFEEKLELIKKAIPEWE